MEIGTKSILTTKIFPGRFYDAFFTGEYGKIEALRASRYNTGFSIVLIDISGFDEKLDLFEDKEASEFLKALVAATLETVRNCDVVGMCDDRQILAILPETDYFGSLVTIRKLNKAASAIMRRYKPAYVICSQATFPKDGRGFGELLSTARKRVADKKESLWEKQNLKNRLFWEIIGELAGKSFKGLDNASFDAGSGQALSEFFIDQINELVVKEVARTPQKRGIIYFGSKRVAASLPVARFLNTVGSLSTKIFLVGEGEESVWEIKNANPLLLDDPRLREVFFTFYLNEDSGYALICKENWGDTYSCFHCSDPYLVEGLITKFQSEYSLQEQLG